MIICTFAPTLLRKPFVANGTMWISPVFPGFSFIRPDDMKKSPEIVKNRGFRVQIRVQIS